MPKRKKPKSRIKNINSEGRKSSTSKSSSTTRSSNKPKRKSKIKKKIKKNKKSLDSEGRKSSRSKSSSTTRSSNKPKRKSKIKKRKRNKRSKGSIKPLLPMSEPEEPFKPNRIIGKPVRGLPFAELPPKVDPETAFILLPCSGTSQDNIQLKIQNHSTDGVVFKVKATKQELFDIEPTMGFVDPMSTGIVRCQPDAITSDDGLGDYESIIVSMNLAKPNHKPEASDVWRNVDSSTTIHRKVRLKFANSEEEQLDLKRKDAKIHRLRKKNKGFKVNIRPPVMNIMTPSRAKLKDCQDILITNDGRERIAFKFKGTCVSRFVIGPVAGFVVPKATFVAKCQPLKFEGKQTSRSPDRITVLVVEAPEDATVIDPYLDRLAERFEIRINYVDRPPGEVDDSDDEYYEEEDNEPEKTAEQPPTKMKGDADEEDSETTEESEEDEEEEEDSDEEETDE